MITPAFELSQDPQYLILSIRVPYTRTSDFDLYIDGTDFKFYAKPYFLRLSLPGRIVEDGREKATFDIDKGLFTLHVPKETAGEHFEGLHMLTSLLAPKGSRSAQPLVEDISMGACAEEEEDEEEFDWQVEQEVYMESSEAELGVLQKYGFGNQRSGVFTRLQEELSDVIDVKNPEGTTAAERRQARECTENSAFCSDHYLADLFEDEEIQRLLRFRPWWTELSCSLGQEGEEAAVCFTDDEKDQLRKFTNRSYLLDKSSRQHTWLSLLDILLAYAYEVRSTEGEHNVESPWTIRKLSGTLCWLETYSSMQEVLVSFGRRVLCFPLYRHFDLISAAVRDTARILQSGKACVLKCLLDIHKIFRENDPAYILNDLYITDYCIWIQRVKSRKVTALAGPLQKTSRCKKDLGLELEELEQAAAMVEKEEDEEQRRSRSNNVPQTLAGDSSSSSSSSDSSSSSSSSSSSDSSEEESDDSEADRQGCTRSAEGGGGGKGGERAKASPPPHPLQPRPLLHAASSPTTTAAPLPSRLPTPPTTVTPSAAGRKPDPLIQELGEQVAEELWISRQAQPLAGHAGDDERSATERSCSQLTTTTAVSSSSSSAGTFLELCPRRNPLLVVKTDSDLDEDDIIG